jgi:hypothetical protein
MFQSSRATVSEVNLWRRGGPGFGLRTIKLRISRKLIFIAGLLSRFSYELDLEPERRRVIFNGDSPLPALAHLKTAMMRSHRNHSRSALIVA